jgi:PAS domain S-box-containing protein
MFHSIKGKILSIYLFLIFLISLIASISIYSLFNLNKAIDGLIASNYTSIAAATNMIDAIERQDSNELIYLEVDAQRGIRAFSQNQQEFLVWLNRAKDNITENDERKVIESANSDYLKYIEYFSKLQEIKNKSGNGEAVKFYDNEIYPVFNSVKSSCRNILKLNEESMFKSKQNATEISRKQMYGTIMISIISILLGLVVSIYFTKKIVSPIFVLTEGVKSVKRGNLNHRININTHDEIGELASEFNNMTSRLLQYDKSSINKLMVEKNKSIAIVKSISDPIIVIDNDYKTTLVNKSAENVFDISEKDVLGRHMIEALGDKKIFNKVKLIVNNDEVAEDNDPIIIKKQNKANYYMLTATSIPNDDDKVSGTVCVFKDITHLKEIEQIKSDFISTVSHELRTPLTSIIMGTKLLLDDTESMTSEQKEIIQAIDEDGGQLVMLVNDLLDLSKLESGKMQINLEKASIFDIAELSLKSLSDVAESREIELINDISPKLPQVYVDYKKIKCVINNLVTNALKYTDKGGIIRISAKAEKGFMRVSVKDNGRGIPEEYHEKIFDKFSQVGDMADASGTGLGLAITKGFVKQHNGDIWVESKPGEGSNFIFTLPLYKG